jgi:hypothetical protein
MAKKPETIVENGAVIDQQGTDLSRVMVMKMFADVDWIRKNVVAKDAGYRINVARVFGIAIKSEEKFNMHGQEKLRSIVLTGQFEGESLVTGEVMSATQVYLPMAYAEKVHAEFERDSTVTMIQVDLDVGIRCTGKTIPYEWTARTYIEDKGMEMLRDLRSKRRASATVKALDVSTRLIEG